MKRMHEMRCCGLCEDEEYPDQCTYIGTYFDCDVYLADSRPDIGKTLIARRSSELTDVYTFNAPNFYRLIEEDTKCYTPSDNFPNALTDIRDVFISDQEPKAIIMACSQMFIESLDPNKNKQEDE